MQGWQQKQIFNFVCTFKLVNAFLVTLDDFRLKAVFLVSLSRFIEFEQIIFIECYYHIPSRLRCKDSVSLKIRKKVDGFYKEARLFHLRKNTCPAFGINTWHELFYEKLSLVSLQKSRMLHSLPLGFFHGFCHLLFSHEHQVGIPVEDIFHYRLFVSVKFAQV